MASRGFWRELKRRHVYRVAAAYALVGWLLIQVATQVFPAFHLPDWIDQAVVLLILIGFPIALLLAWAFDATAHGIVRTDTQGGADLRAPQHSHQAGIAVGLVGVLIAVAAGAVWWHAERGGLAAPVAQGKAASAPSGATSSLASTMGGVSAAKARVIPAPPFAAQTIPAKSIAVLPFENLSADKGNAYFADGMQDLILTKLADIGDLKGDEVRITAQLIDTRSGYHLWSEKYDRKLTSIFAVEDEISKAIADKLQVQLAGGSGQSLMAQKAVDPRAHDFYLHGLPLIAARGPALHEAVADFQQAVAIDPDYAQAWAALAEAQLLLPHYFLEPQDTAAPAGAAAAKRALEIDPDVASAYVALGMHYRVQWKWQDADAAFGKALKIASGDAEAADQYGQYLLAAGRLPDAMAEIDRAQKLDPLSDIIGVTRANVLTAMHTFDDASVQARRVTELRPDYALGHFVAADVAICRHDYAEAKAQLDTGARIVGENPDVYSRLVDGIEEPAKRAAAREAVVTATADAHQRLTRTARIKWLMLLGDPDDALAALQGVGQELIFGQDNVWQPAFDPVRNDPRFQAVLKKMGLPYVPKDVAAP